MIVIRWPLMESLAAFFWQMALGEPIRTLHIDTEQGWRGGEQQAMYLMKGLIARGHHATCACRPGSAMLQKCQAEGIEAFTVAMRSELDLCSGLKLRRIARQQQAQIVHAHTAHAHTMAAMAALGRRDCRCVVSRRVDFAVGKTYLSRLKYRTGVDRYIAISQAVRRVMIYGGVQPDKIGIAHSGIDLERFEGPFDENLKAGLGLPDNAVVVGNVAALVDHKGQKYLLDAVPAVMEQCPDAWFLIAGDGELRGPLERQAAELGIAGRVRFLGYRKDVPDLLNMFDVFVMSSHMEGLCTSLLDAMAMRLPVVATNAGGIPEIVRDGETGLLVESKNPAAIAEGIVKLIKDRQLAARLSERGRQVVEEEFSAGAMVDKTLAIYQDLLSCSDC